MTTTTVKTDRYGVVLGPADDPDEAVFQQRSPDPAAALYNEGDYRMAGLDYMDFLVAFTGAQQGETVNTGLIRAGYAPASLPDDWTLIKGVDGDGFTTWEAREVAVKSPVVAAQRARQRSYGFYSDDEEPESRPTVAERVAATVKRAMSGTERSRLSRARAKAAKAAQPTEHSDAA